MLGVLLAVPDAIVVGVGITGVGVLGLLVVVVDAVVVAVLIGIADAVVVGVGVARVGVALELGPVTQTSVSWSRLC